ncbi:TetR/AcrR family transcriptional regulator [Algoriphagus lacus]|nr:TetR/AcrR family transcriptional regulator [Algoriphagus lacus]
MHPTNDSKKSWIELGYELFSEEGHEGLQVERLARILNKNKSGYYHYFGDKDVFLNALMAEHLERAHAYAEQIKLIKDFDPEYIQLMVKNKTTILFQMQLVKNREFRIFIDTALKVNELIVPVISPVFGRYLGVSQEEASKFWGLLRDSFYSRVTLKTFSAEWISAFTAELRNIVSLVGQR